MTDGTISDVRGGGTERHYCVRYERADTEPISVATATALAIFTDEDVTQPSTRLYDLVDPEALDALFADRENGLPRPTGQVTLRLSQPQARVVITDSTITVEPRDPATEPYNPSNSSESRLEGDTFGRPHR